MSQRRFKADAIHVPEELHAVLGRRALAESELRTAGYLFAVLTDRHGRRRLGGVGTNIVTDAGDVWFAQQAAGETPTNAFGLLELGTAGDAPGKASNRSNMTTKVTGSQKAFDGTYPKTDDGDADNPGSPGTDVVTWLVSYTTAEANDTGIDRAIITNTSPGASEPVLAYGTLTSFNKTSSDTLKFFWNITLNGV